MVSSEEIEQTAENARIALDGDDLQELQDDFEDILDTFSSLDDIDTEDVEPAFHPIELDADMREDEIEDCFSQLDAVMNSPETNREDGKFKGSRAV